MMDVIQAKNERLLAEQLSRHILEKANAYAKREGGDKPFMVALSGGSTPKPLFEYWSEHPHELLESSVHFVWVDERMVPYESDESNFGNALRICFEAINFPDERLHPIESDKEVEASAYAYTKLLEGLAMEFGKDVPIDIAILGMGDDGHTSSLFPGQDLLDKKELFIASIHPTNGVERVALSYHGIAECPELIFHVTGEKKQERLLMVMDEVNKTSATPSNALLPTSNALLLAQQHGTPITLFTTLNTAK